LGERRNRTAEVRGSNPLGSTRLNDVCALTVLVSRDVSAGLSEEQEIALAGLSFSQLNEFGRRGS
jgi:hypothetical protein